MNYKLAGSVILYNPDASVQENIASYIDSLDVLYVVDNGNGGQLVEKLQQAYKEKICPITHGENRGIAASLNEVLRMAEGKYDFLLTMDQDSRFYRDSMAKYKSELDKFAWQETLGLGAAIVDYGSVHDTCTDVKWGGATA